MESSSQDRNLPASQRKLDKAREEGQVARSRELLNLAVVGGGIALMAISLPWVLSRLRDFLSSQLRFDAAVLRGTGHMAERGAQALGAALSIWLPIALAAIVAALVASFAAGGFVLTLKPLMPDFSRVSPLAGIGKLFSLRQVAETAKLLVMMITIGVIAWFWLRGHVADFAALLRHSPAGALSAMGPLLLAGVSLVAGVLLVAAVADVPMQWALHRSQLRMSLQEVKDEHKEIEGSPENKRRLRTRQREIAQRVSIAAVPKADLVVMNPTHYAVALRYLESEMSAPRVVAKGVDLLALRIRDVARENQVPVLEAPMLARALYAHTEIGAEVPAALYTAVAKVLAYVFQLKAAMLGQMPVPAAFEAPEVPLELDPHAQVARKAAAEDAE